jgi:carbamoyl-phosphate synthase large subunit
MPSSSDGVPELHGRVLVTGTGGPSGISFMRALDGEPLTIVSADIDPFASGLYLVPDEQRLIIACERLEIDVVVPTVDSELVPLAAARERFAAAGVELLLASEESLRLCLDKWVLAERCRGTVRLPATYLVDEDFDPAEPMLPVIVKPRTGSGSRGIHLVEERTGLDGLERDGTLLVQENLPGIEYSLDVLATRDGEVLTVVPRARLKIDSGIAITGRTVRDEAREAIGRDVAMAIGLTYVANVQVKEATDGAPALLEVNPRFPGTMPLTVASGVNMPRLCVASALGAPMPPGPIPFEEVAMVRYFEERFFPYEEIARLERDAVAVHDGSWVSG